MCSYELTSTVNEFYGRKGVVECIKQVKVEI